MSPIVKKKEERDKAYGYSVSLSFEKLEYMNRKSCNIGAPARVWSIQSRLSLKIWTFFSTEEKFYKYQAVFCQFTAF